MLDVDAKGGKRAGARARGRGALAGAAAAVLLVALALAGAARSGDDGAVRVPLPGDADGARHWLPGFALEAGAASLDVSPILGDASERRVASPAADVVLAQVGPEEWELVVHAKRAVASVTFPSRSRASRLDVREPSTVLLYPTMLGVAIQAPRAPALGLDWRLYPGDCFAPLLVLAGAHEAEIVAATSWPPRGIVPAYAPDGLALRDPRPLAAGETRRYRALIARRDGDEARGRAPWLLAALTYRKWLEPHLADAGLRPADPDWLVASDGWQNVQLQNLAAFDARALAERWRQGRELLPWLQLWGQMSDYAGRGMAQSLVAREDVGCCIDRIALHERYAGSQSSRSTSSGGLGEVVAEVAAEGRVGLYARPRSPYLRLDGATGPSERRFLLDWLHANQALGANAFYVDVLGHCYFGEPLEIARFVRDELPAGTVLEYAVDVYPRAALVSGSLTGGSFGGGPEREPRELGALAAPRTTFPRFGRVLLGDASLFLGESNGDHVLWGAANGHWAERQAFLLGAKLDAMHVAEARERPDVPNAALRRIVELRRRTGWWRRRPVYLDRLGVERVPDGIDVRRFRGSDGEDLLVVDNPQRLAGASVLLDGRPVALAAEPLSIAVLATGA